MNLLNYIFRSLKFYKKQHIALLLGTILSTAILTGALIVGDSVKYSLTHLVTKRLGKVDFAMQTGDRFVSNELAQKLSVELKTPVAGLLSLKGLLINNATDTRLNSVEVLGVDSLFWQFAPEQMPKLQSNEVFVSENVASHLKLQVGDELLLRVRNAALIPVNTPYSQDNGTSMAVRLSIKQIIDDNQYGRFSLKSDQKAPYNVWVSKTLLWNKMDLKNKVNTVLIQNGAKVYSEKQLGAILKRVWSIDDLNLSIEFLKDSSAIQITSQRIFIDKPIADEVLGKNEATGVFTYLVNSIRFNNNETPYSFVSGVSNIITNIQLAANEIILNQWCATDLGVNEGDTITLEYYTLGAYKKLNTAQQKFVVKSIQANQGSVFNKFLTPNFPGLSDASSCSDWDTGVPIDLEKIRDKDEDYWNMYGPTPKALISIETATQFWGNEFGNYTALRFNNSINNIQKIENELLQNLQPIDLGLQFTNVKNSGKYAASMGVDFGELFLSLSFFVMASGIILLILIYTLNIISRTKDIAVLNSLGFTQGKILKLFMAESGFTIVVGGLLGIVFGIVYNHLILNALNTLWQDAVRINTLEIFIKPTTIITGALIGMGIALLSIYIVIRKQLKGQASQTLKKGKYTSSQNRVNYIIGLVSLAIAVVFVVYSLISEQEINAELFLTAGGLMLISLVSFFNVILKKQLNHFESAPFGILKLALKNLARQRSRSIMAIVLLGLGTFSVIITGANRKTFYGTQEQRQSGTGGFMYWVENSLPIQHDLNSQQGKELFNFYDEPIADSIEFIQMLSLNGDDASCLNLNQVQNPQIIGINTDVFNMKNPFSFAKLKAGVDEHSPWTELDKSYTDSLIPAYLDQTVITWGIMKKVGDTLNYKDELGSNLYLLIAGGLNNSIFQGNVLISESHFRKHFPSVAGSKVMIIESKTKQKGAVAEFLDFYFKDFGIDYTLTNDRLAQFNSVENTYLNIFMILGGFGVAIGTLGFGILLMRNKIERRNELAILLALGISKNSLFKLVFVEQVIMLFIGVLIGVLSAFVGILPSLISPAFSLPVLYIFILVIIILISGIFSILVTSKFSEEADLLVALRRE